MRHPKTQEQREACAARMMALRLALGVLLDAAEQAAPCMPEPDAEAFVMACALQTLAVVSAGQAHLKEWADVPPGPEPTRAAPAAQRAQLESAMARLLAELGGRS